MEQQPLDLGLCVFLQKDFHDDCPAGQILTEAQKDLWYKIDQLIECVTAHWIIITLKQAIPYQNPIQSDRNDCRIFLCRSAFKLVA